MRFFVSLITVFFVACSPSLALAAEPSWLSQKVGLSDADLAQVSVLILVAGPFVGNALAHLLTRLGYLNVAARVAQWTPFATRAASAALRAPTLGQAARAVVIEAKSEPVLDGPISEAAKHLRDFVEDDMLPILDAADPPKSEKDDGGPKLPPGVANSLIALGFIFGLVVLTAALGGCGGGQELAKYAEAGRDLAVVAEPCLVAVKDEAIASCESEECRRQVVDRFAPIADALDLMHETWCRVSPTSEGC